MYNLRGSDIEYNPVFFSYAAVTQNEAFLFVNESQLTPAANEALQAGEVKVVKIPYEDLPKFINDQVSWMSSFYVPLVKSNQQRYPVFA